MKAPRLARTLAVVCALASALAAQVPELMWYRFDEGGGSVTANSAPAATAVGNLMSPVIGHELRPGLGCGGSGALRGLMGHVNYVETGWQPNLPAGAPWSVGFFIDWSGGPAFPTGTSYMIFATSLDPAGTAYVYCELSSSSQGTGISLRRSNGGIFASTSAIGGTGRHHIAFAYHPTVGSGKILVYVDGVQTANPGSASAMFPSFSVAAGQTLRIGGRATPNLEEGLPFDVVLDDLRIFSHSLTPAEVAAWHTGCPAASWSPWVPAPAPPNDSCATPTPVTLGTNGPFTTESATTTPGWSGCNPYSIRDVFFTFTPAVSGNYDVGTCALSTPLLATETHGTNVSIYAGFAGNCSNLFQVWNACSSGCGSGSNYELGPGLGRVLGAPLVAGLPYLIRVADNSGFWRGTFNLTLTPPPPVPPNDDCSAAIPLPPNGAVAGDNTSAASTLGLPVATCVSGMSRDVWYSYTNSAACARTVTLSLCGSTAPASDTVLTVYTGTCGNLALVACDDDSCPNSTHASVLTFTALPGVTYLVAVSSWALKPGTPFTLNVTSTGSWQVLGGGCGSPTPGISATTVPAAGQPFQLTVANGGANAPGALLVAGTGTASTPLPGGCSLLVDLTGLTVLPFTTNGSGVWTVSTTLGPQLACLAGKLQAVVQTVATGNWRTSPVVSFVVGG